MNDHETNDYELDLADLPDLTGMTFHEIKAKYGREVAINAGIAADPEWGPEEMKMSGARPAIEVMPDLVEAFERARLLRQAGKDEQDGSSDGRQPSS